jgi:hypothetical protein
MGFTQQYHTLHGGQAATDQRPARTCHVVENSNRPFARVLTLYVCHSDARSEFPDRRSIGLGPD